MQTVGRLCPKKKPPACSVGPSFTRCPNKPNKGPTHGTFQRKVALMFDDPRPVGKKIGYDHQVTSSGQERLKLGCNSRGIGPCFRSI